MGFSLNLRSSLVLVAAFTAAIAATGANHDAFQVKAFKIDLTAQIPRLQSLVANSRLPAKELYPDSGSGERGIELDVLQELQTDWLTEFDWEAQQADLNTFKQFTAVIEGLTVHFVHEKSADPDAIPVILLHGWPGSFQEFLPVIKPLTESWRSPTGKNISFNVVVPSLPGFVFSDSAPPNWTVDDTARVMNTLMVDGSGVGYAQYGTYNTTVRAAHFAFIPFFPPLAQDIAENNISLSDDEKVTLQRAIDWNATGNTYFLEQAAKPNDVGLALYDSPCWAAGMDWCSVAQIFHSGSDPRAGTPPSALNNTAILTSVSLYYLTDSFLSSVWIYGQNPNVFRVAYTKAPTDAPMLFSQYEYNFCLWPKEFVAKVGNLVSYKFHDFGGHFAGLDNPPALIQDIRDIGLYFEA
ncbi:Epoxide hydrolase domain protein [Mycena venus]|uniref:Epoxide hydrolase domain protein n=1 Tax=Mycena venus TaxID=2733690 RepID=A0A8H7CPQ1_9AGAR|nr:Epoxide hydrolase domain protein [Mycena venus]